jgi:hypothetical protein
MATEVRNLSPITRTTPPQTYYEDLGFGGNDVDQYVIPTSGLSSFDLTINDDQFTNGGDYAAAFVITIAGEVSGSQSYVYVDYTNFQFFNAAQDLEAYYSGLGYQVINETSFEAEINPSGNEQFIVNVQGYLYDNANQQYGGTAHPIYYTLTADDATGTSGGGGTGISVGTDFRDVLNFSQLASSFDGRGNLDTIVFQQNYATYDVDVIGNNRAIVNGVSLANTERLDFANGELALDIFGNAGQVYRLYQAAFDRMPDTAGLAYNVNEVDNGFSLFSMANYFVVSNEFRATYGSNISNNELINAFYQNVLGRNADAGGLQYWNEQMAQGLTRGEVLIGFSESKENVALVGPQIDDGIWLG